MPRCPLLPYILRSIQKRPRLLPPLCFLPTAAILEVIPVIFPQNLPPRNCAKAFTNLQITTLRRRESAQLPHRLGRPLGSTLPSKYHCVFSPLVKVALTSGYVSGSLVKVSASPRLGPAHAWRPLCWEAGYLHPLYCRASSIASLSIQGPMLWSVSPTRAISTGTSGESDQKWAQEPRSSKARTTIYSIFLYVDPQPSTWRQSPSFSILYVWKSSFIPFLVSRTLGQWWKDSDPQKQWLWQLHRVDPR